ncbi:hypothetical protein E2C01_017302 [Portunus trituberculatus]|uniref:Uncharacterized protein n=1 Tax=Portunus trituberculatus TaxID=210409 RepID=A0A5B7DSI1_PORTR|nr:hypothetical protein [Portunus trituberculatus]
MTERREDTKLPITYNAKRKARRCHSWHKQKRRDSVSSKRMCEADKTHRPEEEEEEEEDEEDEDGEEEEEE